MKEIKAYVQPFKLDSVKLALSELDGLSGMTISRVEGYGRGRGSEGPTAFTGESVRFIKYVKLEIVCPDVLTDAVVEAIRSAAHTGLRGDGKIYFSSVEDAVRISTGERGEAAI